MKYYQRPLRLSVRCAGQRVALSAHPQELVYDFVRRILSSVDLPEKVLVEVRDDEGRAVNMDVLAGEAFTDGDVLYILIGMADGQLQCTHRRFVPLVNGEPPSPRTPDTVQANGATENAIRDATMIATGQILTHGATVSTAGSVLGALGATAGTGTAISTLSGAAKTTSTLAWIGNATGFGLGMAGGSLILGGVDVAGCALTAYGAYGIYKGFRDKRRP